ncbi:Extracellular calcium-sensing receptor [Trichoplax sp. H2]|nr:Extracellular calcium-sensing receptor [Trichoplax sp. H2]|eukprot:RDD47827.1 Extracellular calcium-sensing receptor [Trichoplax sp. H2]
MMINCFIGIITFLTTYGSATILSDPYTTVGKLNGDLSLGGLVPIHNSYDAATEKCKNLDITNIMRVQSMIYAIHSINQNPAILPNITLGYEIRDTCVSRTVALRQSINYFYDDRSERSSNCNTADTPSSSDSYQNCTSDVCGNGTDSSTEIKTDSQGNNNVNRDKIISVIGPLYSSEAFIVGTLLSNLHVPVVSPLATSSLLSDKTEFTTFFRTVPSNSFQGRAVTAVIHYFGWNYTAVLWEDDDYGNSLVEEFQRSAKEKNVCISKVILFPKRPTASQLQSIIKELRALKVTVVFIASNAKMAHEYFIQATIANFTGITYIAPISWSQSSSIISEIDSDIIGGTIGLTLGSSKQYQFESYIKSLTACNNSGNPWFQTYFRSNVAKGDIPVNACIPVSAWNDSSKITNSQTITSAFIFNAIYAVAHALHDMLKCNRDHCQSLPEEKFDTKKLVAYLFNVSFVDASRENFSFNQNGNPVHIRYNIVNLQPNGKNVVSKTIGAWLTTGQAIINDSVIVWNKARLHSGVPISACSSDCPPGTYRDSFSNDKCCWKCISCYISSISNRTNAEQCHVCPYGYLPNSNHTSCVKAVPVTIDIGGLLSITLMVILAICGSIVISFWIITILHRHHQVIFSSNSILIHMSYIVLLYMLASSYVFLLPRNRQFCMVTIVTYTTSATLLTAIGLSMTSAVVALFSEVMASCRYSEHFKTKGQPLLVILLLCIQIVIVLLWLILSPIATYMRIDFNYKIYEMCHFQSLVGPIVSLSYIGILNVIYLGLAIKGRHCPDNFADAKYLCVACCINMCIFTFMVLTYFITFGPWQAGISSFSLVACAMSFLLCVMAPKINIMLSFPQLTITVK